MSLGPGSTIGPFKIQSLIGKGGMGEVFSAVDTRLERSVAIKVLPPEFSSDSEVRARFEREARAISNLTHPNICTLYDIGRENGTDYLVMERVEGQTLAERLRKGPLPLEQALEYGIQIAAALDRAHRAGIVHRDLKPGNIMLTKGGVKLLDFGLAKFVAEKPGRAILENQVTLLEKTTPGMVLGTVQYMAPEQVEGSTVDHRTDIFAFGCVLYEMITGRKAFGGTSPTSVMAAILEREPVPLQSLQPLSPAALDRFLKHCLIKSPDERWQTAHDAKLELEGLQERLRAQPTLRKTSKWPLLIGLSLGALLAATGHLLLFRRSDVPTESTALARKWMIRVPAALRETHASFAISPDGSSLAYVGNNRLYVRKLTEFDASAREVPNSQGALLPFWSPDSQAVGFAVGKKLYRVRINDFQAQPIVEVPEQFTTVGGGAWLGNNTIVFGSGTMTNGLLQVSANGGEPKLFVPLDPSRELDCHEPRPLPDGKTVVFILHRGTSMKPGRADTIAVSSGGTKKIIYTHPEGVIRSATYSPTGHILFAAGELTLAIWALPFSLQELQAAGEPMLLHSAGNFPSVANDGTLVFLSSQIRSPLRLAKLDRSGKRVATFGSMQLHSSIPAWSPENDKVVNPVVDPVNIAHSELWISTSTNEYQLTFINGQTIAPSWAPDGSKIVFTTLLRDQLRARLQTLSLTESQPQDVADGVFGLFTSDGKSIVYLWNQNRWVTGPYEIRQISFPPGTNKPAMLCRVEGFLTSPSLSPDDRFLAYVSNEEGPYELYITRFPSCRGRWKVSSPHQAFWPKWRKIDGRLYLFFSDYNSAIWQVAVDIAGDAVILGPQQKLFDRNDYKARNSQMDWPPAFDVSRDGREFLTTESPEGALQEALLNVVENLTAELGGKN